MLKKFALLVGATALAGTGLTLAAGPAQAAPAHAKGSVFLHGTTKMASFPTRAKCEGHAAYELKLVANASKSVTPLPGLRIANSVGPELRFSCYPVRNGQWTYLTAYTSKSGAPLASSDLYVDTSSNRSAQVDNGTSVDSQNVWPFAHRIVSDSKTTSVAQCNGPLKFIVEKILQSPSLRLIGTDTSCVAANGKVGYEADYASTTANGLPYDKAGGEFEQTQPMLDALGYAYPGQSAVLNRTKLARHSNALTPFHRTAWR